MQVILLQDVKNIGRKGQVIDVAEGYARNFLFPQHLGLEASPKALKQLKDQEMAGERKEKKEEKIEKQLAAELDGEEVIISGKADKGKLYAAITAKDVAKALKELGHKVSADIIKFQPVKDIGTYEARLEFETGFEATVAVVIESN